MRRQLEKTIAEFDQFTKQNPKQVIPPANARSMDLARNLLAQAEAYSELSSSLGYDDA